MTQAREAVADSETASRLGFAAIWSGVSLSFDELRKLTGWKQARADDAIGQLLRSGRLELGEGDEIVGAHGVTRRATPHRINHDGRSTHTWCAFDAVGIPAALGIDADVFSACPTCLQPLTVVMRSGAPDPHPAVVWLSLGESQNVMRDFCATANLFCSRQHLQEWLRSAGDPEGEALALDEVAELGRRTWADVAT